MSQIKRVGGQRTDTQTFSLGTCTSCVQGRNKWFL